MHHVGGVPTALQRILIEQCVILSLRIHLMDRDFLNQGMTDHNSRDHLAWVNTLSRLLRQLGLDGAAPPAPEPGEPRPENYDAELAAAARSVVAPLDERSALEARSAAARLAYGGTV
jgi:hypothetical protein